MARGSGGGGGGSGTPSGAVVEMLGESGEINAQGKAKIRKKFFVTDAANLTKIPQFPGYRAVNVTYNKIGGGAFEQNVEYAAQVDATQSPDLIETLQGISGTFEMFTSYESHPIELHPKIDKLTEDFGGYYTPDGFAKWPPFYNAVGGSGLSGGEPQRNPLFGVTRYKEVTMIFRHTFYQKTVPQTIYDKAGKIVTNLPAGFPTPKGPNDSNNKEIKRRWMLQMPAVSREGDAFRVVQEYVLLDSSAIGEGLYEVTTTPGNAGG